MKTSNYFKSFFVITSLLLSLGLQAQTVSETVNVQTAGTLSSLIPAADKYEITSLTVTGDLNGTDIRYIREMAGSNVNGNTTLGKLSVLDLSGANIVAGGSSYYYDYTTSLNEIGSAAFWGCTGLTAVTISNSVTSIGSAAFSDCTGLTSITIPSSVTSIGGSAFSGCTGLASITIPNSVASIGNNAFERCTGLTSITIPNSVTSIGYGTFDECTGLISIVIPNSVTSIGDYAFDGCTGLTLIAIPNSVTSIGFSAFSSCKGLTLITIPNSVTSIGDYAFAYCTKLASITIPNSVTFIGISAFDRCTGLTSITIPNSVTSIGIFAFYGCTKLKEFIVSENNPAYKSVEGVLFSKDCTKLIACPSAKSNIYTLPNSVTSIGSYAFEGYTGLVSITIPNSVTSIGSYAFEGCTGLVSITIPNSVVSIGVQTFIGCTKLKEFIVSENNSAYNSIEGVLFSKDCTELIAYPSAKSNIYTLPNSVTSIGEFAFYDCTGLTSITIPNNVKSIESGAFRYCAGLTSITIPNNVTSIGVGAFERCTGITEIHSKIQTPPNVDNRVFYKIDKTTCKLYIPKGTYSNYLGATGWRDFTNIIEEEATAVSQTEKSNVKVYIDQNAITVTGADFGDNISVYTESGTLLQTTQVTDNTIRITVPGNKIYFIRTAGKVFKVAL